MHPLSAYENHPEYTAQVGLEVINAARAYIYDVSGKDVFIGFTDRVLMKLMMNFRLEKLS